MPQNSAQPGRLRASASTSVPPLSGGLTRSSSMSELPQRKSNRKICFTAPPTVECTSALHPVGCCGVKSAPPSLSGTSPLKSCCKSSTSLPVTDPDPDPESQPVAGSSCTHPAHDMLTSITSVSHIATEYYQQQLDRYRKGAHNETSKMNSEINEIFLQRLKDIDCLAQGDVDLKLVTYQEWVDLLLRVNEALIGNMEQLEHDVSEQLEPKPNMNCRNSPANELAKCHNDIGTLIKIIQNGYHNDCWNIQGINFETLTLADVFGAPMNRQNLQGDGSPRRQSQSQCDAEDEAIERNKQLTVHVKSLVVEVGEKHDEIRELKKQILCMEDEIQKAQQKIQLKDDVVKELRNDLRNANAKIPSKNTETNCLDMPPINLDTHSKMLTQTDTPRTITSNISGPISGQTSGALDSGHFNDDNSQFETLSHQEQIEHQKLRVLEDELNKLFEMTNGLKQQNLEHHRKRLSAIFAKSEAEKLEACSRLDNMRRQLIDLEARSDMNIRPNNDCDSGFSSKGENDQDAKILDALRKRLRKLNESIFELKKRIQKLEIESNEFSTNLQAEKGFSKCNGETLREIADLLSSITGEQLAYNDIYNNPCTPNPFCEFILKMKQCFHKREEQLLSNVATSEHKIQKLETIISSAEDELTQYRTNQKASKNISHTNIFNTSISSGVIARTSTTTTTTIKTPTNTSTMQQDVVKEQKHPTHPQRCVLTAPQRQPECKQPVDSDKDFEHAWNW